MSDEFIKGPVNNKIKEANELLDAEDQLPLLDPTNPLPDPMLVELQNRVKAKLNGGQAEANVRDSLVDLLEQVKENSDFVPGQNAKGQYFGRRRGGH